MRQERKAYTQYGVVHFYDCLIEHSTGISNAVYVMYDEEGVVYPLKSFQEYPHCSCS